MAEQQKVTSGGKRYCFCCSNYSGKVVEGRVVSLHRAPVKLRRMWEQQLRLVRKDFSGLKDNTRVCSEHFLNKSGPISGDDIPSVFPNHNFQTCSVELPTCSSVTLPHETTLMDCEDGEKQQLLQQFNISLPATSAMLHDYSGAVSVSSVQEPTRCAAQCQTDRDVNDHSVQTDQVICAGGLNIGKSAGTQTDTVNDQYVSLKYEHLQHNDETIRIYTGLPNDATFQMLVEEIPKPDDICLTSGRKCALRIIDQLLMTLMRLKLGLVLSDLSFRFGISKANCSKIINKWIDTFVILNILANQGTDKQYHAF